MREATRRILIERYAHTTRLCQAQGIARQILRRDPDGTVEGVTKAYLERFKQDCLADGNSTATINIKLSFFSAMFNHFEDELVGRRDGEVYRKPTIPWIPKGHPLKWWLQPDLESRMVQWLKMNGMGDYADYIQWTTHTGLRLEETLRVRYHHFDFTRGTLSVPGTKTKKAQRPIPLYSVAKSIAQRRFATLAQGGDTYLFDFSTDTKAEDDERLVMARNYKHLRYVWNRLRDVFGLQRDKTATLKALRRSFARIATEHGMPTAMLQKYLGHETIETTIGYLELAGGNDADMMRKWVS